MTNPLHRIAALQGKLDRLQLGGLLTPSEQQAIEDIQARLERLAYQLDPGEFTQAALDNLNPREQDAKARAILREFGMNGSLTKSLA